MSGLKENQSYGLSSGKLSRGGNVSVFHVKLTDSAARAIGSFQSSTGRSSHPTISFNGDQGRIAFPCSENGDNVRIFTFGVTNVARDNPHGSFDCVQQLRSGAAEDLSCLGVIQKKMTVNATDDSYDKARQSMAQAEEETRSRGAIVIKHGGRYQGKKVTVRPPGPALASLTKPKPSHQSLLSNMKKGACISKQRKNVGAAHRTSVAEVQERPLRERVTHLLALRPYKRPELILRLQKDGLIGKDKDMLDSVLMEVGQLNSRDKTFVLKDNLFKELQKDWPGYSSGDQQLLKRILVRRLFQPQQTLLSVPEAQVSPLRDTPNSSPAHRPRLAVPEEYTDPLASKKPRISHLSSKAANDRSRSRPSEQQQTQKDVADVTGENEKRNSLDPKKLIDSLSAVCQQEAEVAQTLEPSDAAVKDCTNPDKHPQPPSDRPPPPLTVPSLKKRGSKRKKSKHKDQKERQKKWKISSGCGDEIDKVIEPSENFFESDELHMQDAAPDYLLKYTGICSANQRKSYKEDFNDEYNEYRDLHARIDIVTQQFMALDTQLKQLHRESSKYKTVHNQILQEYRKIKKSNPNYNQEKFHCEYLHNKLAHIKKLISEYDQQQLGANQSSPN